MDGGTCLIPGGPQSSRPTTDEDRRNIDYLLQGYRGEPLKHQTPGKGVVYFAGVYRKAMTEIRVLGVFKVFLGLSDIFLVLWVGDSMGGV